MYLEDISRASIWWKYLDHNSILPPPFTLIFLFHSAVKKIRLHCQVGFADVNIFVFYVTIVVDKLIIPISYIFDIRQSEMKWTKRTEVKKNANSTKGDFLPIETLVPYQPANFELILSGIASSRSGFATKIGGWQNELLPSFCISPFSLS